MAAATRVILTRLGLRRFRNYASLTLDCAPGLNLLVGSNGQGKTNLLEAVHVLAFLRSFRTRQVQELVQWSQDVFDLDGTLAGPSGRNWTLQVRHGRERLLLVNGVAVARASEFINRFHCVAFIPEDIGLAKGPAAERRRFLDMLAGQLDARHLHHLHILAQALKNRNAALRQPQRFNRESRAPYDELIAEHGAAVADARARLVADLQARCSEPGRLLLEASLTLRYRPGFAWDPDREPDAGRARLAAALAGSLARDERERVTTLGPQRDDVDLELAGHPLSLYGSEGQCRAAALVLRLAAVECLRNGPDGDHGLVLLVDDVLGELDAYRRDGFWRRIRGEAQIFLTCTAVPPELHGEPRALVEVTAGTLRAAI